MQNVKEWWYRMFEMHARLMESHDDSFFQDFKRGLDTVTYPYAKPREEVGLGARFVKEVAGWLDDDSRLFASKEDCDATVTYLERALAPDYDDTPLLKLKIACANSSQRASLVSTKGVTMYIMLSMECFHKTIITKWSVGEW